MESPQRRFELTGGNGHFDSHGRGVWVGHLLAVPFPAVPSSIGGGATFSDIQDRVAVARCHRLRGVHVSASGASGAAVDVYRHLPVPPPLTATLASPAEPGSVDEGPHAYAVVFKDAEGGRTTPSPVVLVTVEDPEVNGKVRLKVPLGPEGTASREVYRTPSGSADLLLLVDLEDNTTVDYLDDTADSELGPDAPVENTTGESVLTEFIPLSDEYRSVLDQPLRGELDSDPATILDPCLYSLRVVTVVGEGGGIQNLQGWLEIEFVPE